MNSDLEFRVWDETKRKWHCDPDGYVADTEWVGINDLVELIHQKGFVIQQFTGVYDKNGKKIFLGDIVKGVDFAGRDYFVSEIFFRKGAFRTKEKSWQVDYDLGSWAIDLFVIGNIFENPDLIK